MAFLAPFVPLIAAAVTTAGSVYAVQQSKKAASKAQPQQQQQAIPEVGEVEPMPVSDDAAVDRAKRASATSQLRRRGRASTILTDLEGNTGLGG